MSTDPPHRPIMPPSLEWPNAFARATIRQGRNSLIRVVDFRGGELIYDRDDELVLSMGLTASHSLDYAVGGTRTRVVPMIGRFGLMTP